MNSQERTCLICNESFGSYYKDSNGIQRPTKIAKCSTKHCQFGICKPCATIWINSDRDINGPMCGCSKYTFSIPKHRYMYKLHFKLTLLSVDTQKWLKYQLKKTYEAKTMSDVFLKLARKATRSE